MNSLINAPGSCPGRNVYSPDLANAPIVLPQSTHHNDVAKIKLIKSMFDVSRQQNGIWLVFQLIVVYQLTVYSNLSQQQQQPLVLN